MIMNFANTRSQSKKCNRGDAPCSPGRRLLPPARRGTWPSAPPSSCTHLWQRQQRGSAPLLVITHHATGRRRRLSRRGRAALISGAVLGGEQFSQFSTWQSNYVLEFSRSRLNPLTTMAGKHTGCQPDPPLRLAPLHPFSHTCSPPSHLLHNFFFTPTH